MCIHVNTPINSGTDETIRSLIPAMTWLLFLLFILHGHDSQAESLYQVQPGDIITVSVWNEDELDKELLVRPDGYFSFPLVGDILAAGQAVVDIRDQISAKLETFIPGAEVNVSVLRINGNKVYVLGKVAAPGPIVLNHDIDVMQALSIAGGTTTFAGLNKIKILRRENGVQHAIPFRYAEVEDGRNLEQNILLRRGDIVVVP